MTDKLKQRILRYALIIISCLIFAGGTVYTINGITFGYILYGFLGALIGIIVWNRKQPQHIEKQVPVFLLLFNLLIYLGGIMINGLDGSAPVVFIIWTVLSISILPVKWSIPIIVFSVLEQISFRVLHETTTDILVPYADYETELNDKTFIFIAGCATTGLIMRSYLLKNNKSQKEIRTNNQDLIRQQNELTKKTSQLKESNERLEEFAYVASHDLISPIRATKLLLDFTLEDFENELPNEAKDNLLKAQKSMGKMNSLVTDLLSFSRADSIELSFDDVNLNEMIADISSSYTEDETINISCTNLPTINVDKVRTREVFYNLIANGLKYNQSALKTIELGFDDKTKTVWVRDNGIGIAQKHHEKVFQIFQRLHNNDEYEGTGTGLALVKRILERQDISISIESELGKGTKFLIDFSKNIKD